MAGQSGYLNSLVIANKYSCCKLGNWVEYQHRFGNCEVTEGKIALRFEVAETTGLEGTPKSTEVVLQSFFCLESRGRFCCPEWSRDFRWSSLRPVPGGGGDCLGDRRTPWQRGRHPSDRHAGARVYGDLWI